MVRGRFLTYIVWRRQWTLGETSRGLAEMEFGESHATTALFSLSLRNKRWARERDACQLLYWWCSYARVVTMHTRHSAWQAHLIPARAHTHTHTCCIWRINSLVKCFFVKLLVLNRHSRFHFSIQCTTAPCSCL